MKYGICLLLAIIGVIIYMIIMKSMDKISSKIINKINIDKENYFIYGILITITFIILLLYFNI